MITRKLTLTSALLLSVLLSFSAAQTDVARGKPATSSSQEGGYSPGNAVDGNSGTRWGSAFGQPQWLKVDLEGTYAITRVLLNWERASAETYSILVSDVNSTPSLTDPDWRLVVRRTGMPDAARVDDLTGLSGSGRYIAMYGENRLHRWGFSLWDFEVYGTSGPEAPVITSQPADQTVTEGETATFSVTATGTAPLSYQWRKNGATISGATGDSYTTPAATMADNGAHFDVVVSNAAGSVTSNAATLTVTPLPPVIIVPPADQSVIEGQTATFTVSASSSVAMTYQWRKNGANIAGATSDSYTTPPTTLADNGSAFDVVVSNAGGSTTSTAALLTVTAAVVPPSIVTPPADQAVNEGQTAFFSVTASGTAPLSYQWRRDGSDIPGANSASYTTPATTMADNGAVFDVVVSNSAGSVTSPSATLTVNPAGITPNSKKIAITGELMDALGNPVGYPDPVDVDATIRLYDAESGGSAMYIETFLTANGQAVTVEDGLFVARLGEGTAGADLQTVVSGNTNLWVEITIENSPPEVLLPRTPLTASAYSLGGTTAAGQQEAIDETE